MVESSSTARAFPELFAKAAEVTIRESLGEGAATTTLYHIKSLFPDTDNILMEPDKFAGGLTEIFGSYAAKVLVKLILDRLPIE